MKKFIIAIAALCMTFVATAQDNLSCKERLQKLSEVEMAARDSYLANTKGNTSRLMEDAAKSFDTFANSCGLGPMAYAGVLVHGRLSLIYRVDGKSAQADIAAANALRYAEALRKRKVTWSEVESTVREADQKQRLTVKK